MKKVTFNLNKAVTVFTGLLIFSLFNMAQASELEVSEQGNGYQTAESPADSVQPAEDVIYGERLRTDSAVSVGKASYFYEGIHLGGVIFADHTIVNSSLNSSGISDVPVTFGDDVRIDGEIWRGPAKGTSDNQPLKFSDTLVPTQTRVNDFGDTSRYWRNGYFSGDVAVGNLVGTGVVHPINLAASTAATTGQVLAINDEGNFEWVTIGDSSETVSVGDITSVIAGTGIIVANGTSGDATVSLNTTYTDNRYVNVTGDDMIGALTITGTDSSMLSVSNAGSNTRGISSIASEGYGVYGINGATTGSTPSNYRAGVYGETNGTGWNYNGVYGQADNSVGVYGYSGSEDYPGIRGYNDGGGVGIYGHTADSDSDNFGIYGVHGEADESDGRGVYGESDSGVGVYGESTSGYSGYFNGELRVEGDINQELDHGGAVKAMAYVDVSEECIAEPTEVGRQYNSQGGIIECQIGATGIFDVDFNFDISNRYIQVTSINGTYDIAEASHVSVIPNTVDVDTVRVFIQDGATLDMANRDFYIAVF